jgi:hypothetical protein
MMNNETLLNADAGRLERGVSPLCPKRADVTVQIAIA